MFIFLLVVKRFGSYLNYHLDTELQPIGSDVKKRRLFPEPGVLLAEDGIDDAHPLVHCGMLELAIECRQPIRNRLAQGWGGRTVLSATGLKVRKCVYYNLWI